LRQAADGEEGSPASSLYGGFSTDDKIRRAKLHLRSGGRLPQITFEAHDHAGYSQELRLYRDGPGSSRRAVANGDNYFLRDTGNFYKRTAAGTWSLVGKVGSCGYGMVYRRDTDSIHIPKSSEVARYFPVSNSPSLSSSRYATSADQSLTGGG
jgi:hypothetical protein